MVSGWAHTCASGGQLNCRVDDDDDMVNRVTVLALLWDSRRGEDVRRVYLLVLVLRFVKKKKSDLTCRLFKLQGRFCVYPLKCTPLFIQCSSHLVALSLRHVPSHFTECPGRGREHTVKWVWSPGCSMHRTHAPFRLRLKLLLKTTSWSKVLLWLDWWQLCKGASI